jgi:hypothetical protein
MSDTTALLLPEKPSIAVLPFQNMSGDSGQEYFVDGMVEEIITALSRIRWLFVIARNSTFTYKGQAIDVKQVGRELGVRYVLEGSVRKAGGRVRGGFKRSSQHGLCLRIEATGQASLRVFSNQASFGAGRAAISSALCMLRSVPLGKYWRSSPLVFSLVPRCHGEDRRSIPPRPRRSSGARAEPSQLLDPK